MKITTRLRFPSLALILFVRRVTFLVRLMLTGKPAERWDHVPARVRNVVVFVADGLRRGIFRFR